MNKEIHHFPFNDEVICFGKYVDFMSLEENCQLNYAFVT